MKSALLGVLLAAGVALAQLETARVTTNTHVTALSEEFKTIGTATYYLASVDNSGVNGHVHIAETFEGSSRVIMTMNNTLPDYRYAVVLYEGDCGPDRPEVLRLGDINNTSGDPNTSITEAELNFEQFTQGNYFMYVFAGEPGTQVLACGEVGQDANRMGM
jgi:hypothetical protein